MVDCGDLGFCDLGFVEAWGLVSLFHPCFINKCWLWLAESDCHQLVMLGGGEFQSQRSLASGNSEERSDLIRLMACFGLVGPS